MNTPNNPRKKHTDSGRVWAGAIILGLGVILLVNRLDFHWIYFPSWLFSWPMVLVVVGLVIGSTSNFKNPTSYILLIIGGFFLMNNIWDLEIRRYIWPAAIIGVGIWLLMDKKQKGVPPHRGNDNPYGSPPDNPYAWDKRVVDESDAADHADAGYHTQPSDTSSTFVDDDYVKITCIFGDVRRMVMSKNFRGGEAVTICGGADINLMQADIKHPVTIDMFQLFAGTKIIVPAHWKVKSDVVSVFGEVDDRRFAHSNTPHDDHKILYIRGTSIFGGVTIKST